MNIKYFGKTLEQTKHFGKVLLCTGLILAMAQSSFAKGSVPQPKDDSALAAIDGNLSAMVGQMLLLGFRGLDLSEDPAMIKVLQEGRIGGVILFYTHGRIVPYNLANPEQIVKLTKELNTYSKYPLFIGVDQEGGQVQRISSKNGFKDWPSAEVLGKGTPENTFSQASEMGNTLASLGFNLNFAPSVDLLDSTSAAIGSRGRSFHSTALVTIDHATAFSKAMEKAGIIPTLKHFPGHGSAKKDTHLGFTDITTTWRDKELLPYKEMIADGYKGMIMTSHVYHADFDDKPASLSSAIITKLLREKIGFKGVVVTDDMQMGAIVKHYSLKESILLTIQSGTDILLFGNNLKYDPDLPNKIYNHIMELIAEGKISEERIEESWKRIRAMKEYYLL